MSCDRNLWHTSLVAKALISPLTWTGWSPTFHGGGNTLKGSGLTTPMSTTLTLKEGVPSPLTPPKHGGCRTQQGAEGT